MEYGFVGVSDLKVSTSDFLLSDAEVASLDEASHRSLPYPCWHQRTVRGEGNPAPV